MTRALTQLPKQLRSCSCFDSNRSLFFVTVFFLLLKSSFAFSQEKARPRGSQPPSSISEATPLGLVKKITIRGNKKIESDAVLNKISTRVNEPLSKVSVRKDVEELFKTGFFYDIEVRENSVEGGIEVIYVLTEKPSMVEIIYEGNSEIEDDDLREQSGLKPYELLDYAKLKEAEEKLLKFYEDKGYFLAKVKFRVEDINKGDTVKVIFDISENDKVKVKQITILGNRRLSAEKIESVMQTKEGGFFSFITGSGSYKQDAFDRDMANINYLYLNEGFLQAKIDRPQVFVSPDQTSISISIRVEEGEKYNIGTVDFTGDLLFSREELFESVGIDDRKVFSLSVLQEDVKTLQAKYGDLGYAFANPIPRTRTRDGQNIVDIVFEIEKGNKVYFGKITMKGNSKTRDKVIRRELRIREGELYHETRRRESVDNVKRLGYFDEVVFNTRTPPDDPDRLDLDIEVKERNTGILTVGAGYSTYSKFIFNGRVDQINLFGKGQKLGASVDISKRSSLYNLSFTEPYLLDTEWSLGGRVYQQRRVTDEWTETKTGGAITVGHPLAPYLRGFITYKLDNTKIELDDDSDPDIYPVETANGKTSSVTTSIEYDKRNDRYIPTKGFYSSFSIEYAGLGGDLDYTKGSANARYYREIFWDLVLRNNITYGFVASNISGREPPFNELFLLGGPNSLRGFREVGQRKRSKKAFEQLVANGDPEAKKKSLLSFGGKQQLFYNLELEFPVITEAGIKGVVFYDIGAAQDNFTPSDFRSDIGFGFRWFSPIGPLRFEWGFPLEREKIYGERSMEFNFSIGSPF